MKRKENEEVIIETLNLLGVDMMEYCVTKAMVKDSHLRDEEVINETLNLLGVDMMEYCVTKAMVTDALNERKRK